MSCLRLVLGDQLNPRHPWFREKRRDVVYVLMEVRSETDSAHHHAQKILALFAAMRGFAAALEKAGHRVEYVRLSDSRNRQSFADNLPWLVRALKASRLERMEADEWRVERGLDEAFEASGLPTQVVDAGHFLVPRGELISRFARKVPRMEFFYRDLRKRHGILVDAHGEPEGQRWNFDVENRARWNGDPPAPPWPHAAHDVRALWEELQASGVKTIGNPRADALPWPLSRREALRWLADFVEHRLAHFGRFQDAISSRSETLFHSGLSFALNTKMLHPREVIDAAVRAYKDGQAGLAQTEGFVRQILGWREFVRGVYWARMPRYRSINALEATRPLPSWFWTGETKLACVGAAVRQSLDRAYAHHIQRLMLTGNFALLAGCHPDEVDAWYLGIYIDAFEWVELPNTRGMSQFADGGVVGSKPYCGSAAYVKRQSDHCAGCHYRPDLRHGERACPLNSLYWHFHARHRKTLGHNVRLAMTYRSWDRFSEAERRDTLAQAERYLADLDAL